MIGQISRNIRELAPILAFFWVLTITLTLIKPQRYFNSLLLAVSLMVTMVFISGLMGNRAGSVFLLVCFLAVMLALFLVPVLLILNGIEMIRKESLRPAHLLSLGVGVAVGIGEIAAVVYVLNLADLISLKDAGIWVVFTALTVFYFSSLLLCFVLYSLFIQIIPRRMNFNYVIIHGCGLKNGETLTKLLSDRVDRAIRIYEKCRVKPIIIPSGGQGADEKISEAGAMAAYLTAHGIPGEHILTEDKSATTRENLINSKAIIDSREGRKKTALVSSNYHIYRCLRIARSVGLNCTGIGAHVAPYYWPSALIREFIAVFLEKRFLIWALIGYALFTLPVLLYMNQ